MQWERRFYLKKQTKKKPGTTEDKLLRNKLKGNVQNIGKILNTPEIYKKTQDEIFKNGKRFFFW